MGLDATVYCDCVERNRLRSKPLPDWKVYVEECGARSSKTGRIEEDLAFDQWNFSACEHESGILLHHRIGNIATVALLRCTLSEHSELFAFTLSQVVYK